jgi:hypothetical protein
MIAKPGSLNVISQLKLLKVFYLMKLNTYSGLVALALTKNVPRKQLRQSLNYFTWPVLVLPF